MNRWQQGNGERGNSVARRAGVGPAKGVLYGALAGASLALAQSSGGQFEISKHSIDSGGGAASGSAFELTGAIAQPDADTQTATGGGFSLAGGFWANATPVVVTDAIFSDSFEGP